MTNVGRTIGGIVLFMSAMLLGVLIKSRQYTPTPEPVMQLKTGIIFRNTETLPPLTFTDQAGLNWTPKKIYGKWSLFFFGYSQCPSFCPEILEKMDLIGKNFSSNELECLFVSINPSYDSPKVLSNFLEQYPTPIRGLSGSSTSVNQLATFFKIHVEEAKGQVQHIEHASALVLVDPYGRPCGIFTELDDISQVIADIHTAQKQLRYTLFSTQDIA
ncbi:MAG: SCO family protein [Gammaproteobacteria bacterium]|nr:SCO family protein [Gammaproteobacteria bacterium]